MTIFVFFLYVGIFLFFYLIDFVKKNFFASVGTALASKK